MIDNYTKMCDCPEIQDGWEPKVGDWVCVKGQDTMGFWSDTWLFDKRIVEGLKLNPSYIYGATKKIHLPSIEQLMEMVFPTMSDFVKSVYFHRFISNKVWCKKPIAKELWLAFVMHELHGLEWSGFE